MADEREIKHFKQIVKTLDDSQIKWILNGDYPEWEQQVVKEESERRKVM